MVQSKILSHYAHTNIRKSSIGSAWIITRMKGLKNNAITLRSVKPCPYRKNVFISKYSLCLQILHGSSQEYCSLTGNEVFGSSWSEKKYMNKTVFKKSESD